MKIVKMGLIALLLLFMSNNQSHSAPGPEAFIAQGCNKCHSVKVEKIQRLPGAEDSAKDLSKVGTVHDKKWIAGWLLKKTELDGEKHKQSFTGTTEELKIIATWLEGLK